MERSFSQEDKTAPSSSASPAVPGKEEMIHHPSSSLELEMPVEFLQLPITPVSHFFVRNHLDEPAISPGAEWRLTVAGEVKEPIALSFSDLTGFAPHSITAVLECAGNGRAFYRPETPGSQWQRGAAGNANFSGVRLRDLLLRAGLKATGKHVLFRGLEEASTQSPAFIRSIPIEKALDEDTLVATHMNHAPLTKHHGFPARAIVPGWVGASWCKWLTEIRVIDQEFDGEFMKNAYRIPRQPVPPGTSISHDDTCALTRLNTKSIIVTPVDGATVTSGTVRISGAAWTNDAAEITRVDISTDAGVTWEAAELEGDPVRYAWRLWSYTWKDAGAGDCIIMSRATDSRGNRQPETAAWNPGGYLYNAVDRVKIQVQAATGGTS